MGTAYNASVVKDGLVLYLDAANPKSYPGTGTTWYDLSGNGRHATKAGSQSPTYPLFSNGYFTFTGGVLADNYSRFQVSVPNLNAVTAFAIHYSTQAGNHVMRMSSDSFQLGPDGFCAGVSFSDIGTGGDRTATLNTWVCDALTFNGSNLIGYRNGVSVASATRGTPTGLAGGTLNIGTRNDAYAAHYVGRISLVIIYDRVLSANEIQQNFIALRGRYGI